MADLSQPMADFGQFGASLTIPENTSQTLISGSAIMDGAMETPYPLIRVSTIVYLVGGGSPLGF